MWSGQSAALILRLYCHVAGTSTMAERISKAQRSYNMSRIRSKKNVTTEESLATLFRVNKITGWRRHVSLPGTPDFAFFTEQVAVFVDGCFWHRCRKCNWMPVVNSEFWQAKLARNAAKDRQVTRALKRLGWIVVRIWEHSLKRSPGRVIKRVYR